MLLLSAAWALSTLLAFAQANGELLLLHTPNSVSFSDSDAVINQSLLKELFSAVLGFTPKQHTEQPLVSVKGVLNFPEAVVAVAIEGVESLGKDTTEPARKRFGLNVDEVEETTWQVLSGRIAERGVNNTLVRMYLGDGIEALGHSALGELKIEESPAKHLKRPEDQAFIEQLGILHSIAKNIPTAIGSDKSPDVYWLVVSGLKAVLDGHGKSSEAAKEAYALLYDALSDVSAAFKDVYGDKVLITAFTNNASKVGQSESSSVRRKREADPKKKELPMIYSEDYPVIFNIILWFGVAFVFSLLAICIFIADMDPGRDSIIYRMTSNRMKKDN